MMYKYPSVFFRMILSIIAITDVFRLRAPASPLPGGEDRQLHTNANLA